METGGPAAVCEEAAGERSDRGRDDGQHSAVLRRGGAGCGSGRGSGSEPVQGDQPLCEEDGSERCAESGVVSGEGFVAGGADEGQDPGPTGESDANAGHAGETEDIAEEQGQQYSLGAWHQPRER